jgi:XTP/dITP diphosphohydrolase
MKIAFVSNNLHKVEELKILLKDGPIDVVQVSEKIEELQTQDDEKLVKDKLLKAFAITGKPVFVEHTGLHINYLNGFPGGLTEIFWEKLKHEKFAELVGNLPDNTLTAKTSIGYCDGKCIYFFSGEISGTVPKSPRGPLEFQWDSVFIPDGSDKTFAEMGTVEKNKISMRKIAYDKFLQFLITDGRAD